VDEQIRAARGYNNRLIELERTRRAVYREIVGEVRRDQLLGATG